MQRIVGGVEIKRDLLGPPQVRLQEQVHEQIGERSRIVVDLVIAVVHSQRRVLQAVEGALSASGAQAARFGSSRSANSASTGSWRSWSRSFTSS